MIDVVNKNDYISVLNLVGVDLTSYYSKRDNKFHVLEQGERVPGSFVETPCREAIEGSAMRYFWKKHLGKSEWWFESTNKCMGYLIRHDLVDDYRKVEVRHAFAYMQAWAADNDIVLDWDELLVV